MTDALRKALKLIDKHSAATIRTNSKDRGDWAEDMAYVGKVAREALAASAAPAVPPEWQPIETAPAYPFVKERWYVDGPRYLLSTGSSVFIGQYGYTERGKGRWQDHYGRICQPTHWMPLTAAPTAQQEPKP